MNTIKKIALAIGLAASFSGTSAFAAPSFSLAGGYTGDIVIKFRNFENVSPTLTTGAENFGVLNITSITDTVGNNLWTSGGANGYLGGIFADITVLSSIPDSGGGLNVQGTGGQLDIYLSSTAPNAAQGLAGYGAAGCAPGDLCYNTISNTGDGILFLSLAFASGIDPTNPMVTVDANFDGTTFPTSGDASSYMNVIGGAYAANFDTNGLATAFGVRDMFTQNDFCDNGTPSCGSVGDWDLQSDDPTRASFRSVPEPSTTALLGLGLLGLAVTARRKK